MSETVRFWSQVQRGGSETCWPWTGKKIKGGYGDFVRFVDGKWTHSIAHRWSWVEANGPIPRGLFVCHRCDNPPCVNPSHLFLGTALDNERDKIAKGRLECRVGERNPNARIGPDDVREIRRLRGEGRTLAGIARRYGLHPETVRRIALGRSWCRVDAPVT